MIFKELTLTDFRNFPSYSLSLHDSVTVLEGPNSVGKTNLLEALYLTMSGKGIKEEKQEELVRFGQTSSTLVGLLTDQETNHTTQIHVVISLGETVERKYAINKVTKSQNEFIKQMPSAILFTPQRIELITQSPSRRRKVLDGILCRIDDVYRRALSNYTNGLIKRNKLLERGNSATLGQELGFWDSYLVEHGSIVQQKRKEYAEKLNEYQPFPKFPLEMVYLPNELSLEKLQNTVSLQLRYRNTLFGPQRDDFDILFQHPSDAQVSVLRFGSRSQQRLALLWLNLHELLMHVEDGNRPVLLLDDIFSELDEHNKQVVLSTIRDFQTVMTTNDASAVGQYYSDFSLIPLA